VSPGNAIAPRLPHRNLIECYRDAAVPLMTLPVQALDALLQIWDANLQWEDDRLLALILATIANETKNFRVRVENLSFGSAERIQSLWPSRFLTLADAAPFVNNPEALAERVYGDRFDNNKEPGDAWRYRGRGMPMLPGRDDYERYGREINVDLLATPELVLNPAVGARVAFAVYFEKDTVAELNTNLNQKTTDWDAIADALHKVSDKNGIPQKSNVFYDCIDQTKPK
jgi:predicted chitinase